MLEHLTGFTCGKMEEALGFAKELGKVNPGGSYEIRPIALFLPQGAPGAIVSAAP